MTITLIVRMMTYATFPALEMMSSAVVEIPHQLVVVDLLDARMSLLISF